MRNTLRMIAKSMNEIRHHPLALILGMMIGGGCAVGLGILLVDAGLGPLAILVAPLVGFVLAFAALFVAGTIRMIYQLIRSPNSQFLTVGSEKTL